MKNIFLPAAVLFINLLVPSGHAIVNDCYAETVSYAYRGRISNPSSCRGVTPLYVVAGSRTDIVISGKNTNFDNETEVSFSCNTLVQNDLITVNSPGKITMDVTVMDDAVDADPCSVTVISGEEEIICDGFAVLAEAPCLLVSADPSTVSSGWMFPRLVFITLEGDENCTFGLTGLSVVSGNSYLLPIVALPFEGGLVVPAVVWPGAERRSIASLVVAGADNYIDISIEQGILP